MKNADRAISVYSADTAGVCSALYELGGMTVVHDASGCNSTYTTHDEPRWYSQESMIYISALTEMDAVMGGDEKLVEDVTSAAMELEPAFIAVCGSPVPMMTGTDFDAVAREIQARTGIPAFGMPTDGMHSYLSGASLAFEAVADRFCTGGGGKTRRLSANILGATPLDFSDGAAVTSMRRWLEENGFSVNAVFAMGSGLEEISSAGRAHVNLVVSWDGMAAARLLRERFGTPFVAGVPVGRSFSGRLAELLRKAADTGECSAACAQREREGGAAVVGESIYSGSVACALAGDCGCAAYVVCPLETEDMLMAPCDRQTFDTDGTAAALAVADMIVADPLYRPICPDGIPFFGLAHEAFSGRCFHGAGADLIGRDMKEMGWNRGC